MKSNFNFDRDRGSGPGADRLEPGPERLSALLPGEAARVIGVDESAPAGRRLLDLGFLPGTPVYVVRRAPLRDPLVYELRGYRICLRRTDAAHVRVERVQTVEGVERERGAGS